MTAVEKVARHTGWETPRRILGQVDIYSGGQIGLDPCTTAVNPTRAKQFYYPPAFDGLQMDWGGKGVVFVNPPYGPFYKDWLTKVASSAVAGVEVVALLPANRFEQGYFHYLLVWANMLTLVRKRVAFINPETGKPGKANYYPSLVVGFNTVADRFYRSFSPLGFTRRLSFEDQWAA